jgi:adenine/guanine phosphoribosyltransferase-like PRPP-binding protein
MKNPFEGHQMIFREEGISRKFSVEEIMKETSVDVRNLLEKRRSVIENREVAVVLGVDGSGRVPALLVGKTIQNIYKRMDEDGPEIRFISGSRSFSGQAQFDRTDQMEAYFKEHIAELVPAGKKVLVVDDVIESGNSVLPIVGALQRLGLSFEIMTCGHVEHNAESDSFVELPDLEELFDTTITAANAGTPHIYGRKSMAGVIKSSDSLISTTLRDKPENPNGQLTHSRQDIVRRTRELIIYSAEQEAEAFIAAKANTNNDL